ncbi:hypothetical protein EDD15DRAFT_2195723 [Pisolithus albus]|nr:hypothetical protein EDD15DRAFT_2195723 [Pisolithus albus]
MDGFLSTSTATWAASLAFFVASSETPRKYSSPLLFSAMARCREWDESAAVDRLKPQAELMGKICEAAQHIPRKTRHRARRLAWNIEGSFVSYCDTRLIRNLVLLDMWIHNGRLGNETYSCRVEMAIECPRIVVIGGHIVLDVYRRTFQMIVWGEESLGLARKQGSKTMVRTTLVQCSTTPKDSSYCHPIDTIVAGSLYLSKRRNDRMVSPSFTLTLAEGTPQNRFRGDRGLSPSMRHVLGQHTYVSSNELEYKLQDLIHAEKYGGWRWTIED